VLGWLRAVPAVTWVPAYERRWLRPDILAALAVWAVLVPQALAYASLAGVPPEAGLYAALAALVLYALLGTSRHLSVGPISAIAALSAATIGSLPAGHRMGGLPAAGRVLTAAKFHLEMLETGAEFGLEQEVENLAALGLGIVRKQPRGGPRADRADALEHAPG